ncbi:transposase [Candidatus Regiella insecticola LSR1]|uniref:Transposase n=1 Tax=Candidatus Regiella insecticola LSR1 TaxID=663321 RepID=E0WT05_9ENTR|nr:hypothetical protein [Candidatus Regiella insecticola]EFL91690.1 transposase [Candidatus Regiella insecticola LSR1]
MWAKGDWRQINDVIADKGYDFYDVKKLIRDSGKYPVIPRRQGAIYPGIQPKDKEKYKTRNAIERFFGKKKNTKDSLYALISWMSPSFLFSPSLVLRFLNYFVNSAAIAKAV